jgi:hypothetical protein
MAVFKPRIKDTTEDRLQRAINLGREEALKEVLKWLEENFYEHECFSFDFVEDIPYQCPVECDFESKEQMLQSFKERFNIE